MVAFNMRFQPAEVYQAQQTVFACIYVQTHLHLYSLNVFALHPKLLQGIRRQNSQVAYHRTSPYQTECDISKNCSVTSHSLNKCII